MCFPSRDPGAVLLDLSDEGAWERERRSAEKLEDLVSKSGMPYHEIEGSLKKTGFREKIKCAKTDFEIIPGTHQEIAYWCSVEKRWVQGAPSGEEYDDIGVLSGSAGLSLFCRSCGQEIGKEVRLRS
jgi:hypothetical protein